MPMGRVGRSFFIGAGAGVLLIIGLLVYLDFSEIVSSIAVAGWAGLSLITIATLPSTILCGVAWFQVVPEPRKGTLSLFVWARLLRDAMGNLIAIPLSEQVIAVRVLTKKGFGRAETAAGIVVDGTAELLSQLLFTLIGLGILFVARPDDPVLHLAVIGVAIATPALIGFLLVQTSGIQIMERISDKLADSFWQPALHSIVRLHKVIHDLYRNRRGFYASFLLHAFAWILGALVAWVGLGVLNYPVAFHQAIVIESLMFAVSSAAFFVPGALGVQEGGYVVFCSLFGIPPEAALALSLLKRGRDVLLGIPAILIWQAMEGKQLWRRKATTPPVDIEI